QSEHQAAVPPSYSSANAQELSKVVAQCEALLTDALNQLGWTVDGLRRGEHSRQTSSFEASNSSMPAAEGQPLASGSTPATEEAVAATERRVRRRLKRLREEAKRKSAASSSEHRAAASASSAAACVQRRRKHKTASGGGSGVQYSRDYKLVLRHLIQQMMEEGQASD
ncbi:hypothetical protein BOX15_Mlig028256g7, partial [Macrostomum lignano]